jgi:flagellar biosynthesis/type III secretory pathway ATPase
VGFAQIERLKHAALNDGRTGDGLLGRVVDALGRPLDGLGSLADCERSPVMARPINVLPSFLLMYR